MSALLRISFYTLKWFIPHRCVWWPVGVILPEKRSQLSGVHDRHSFVRKFQIVRHYIHLGLIIIQGLSDHIPQELAGQIFRVFSIGGNRYTLKCQLLFRSGGWICATDLKDMSLASYYCSTPPCAPFGAIVFFSFAKLYIILESANYFSQIFITIT